MTTPAPAERAERARAALEAHVLERQRSVRSCTGCGLCCTETYNAVHVLPVEGARIARWLQGGGRARRAELLARVRAALARTPALRSSRAGVRYTCPFLEQDLRCALPLSVKPVACLAFNPITRDRCDQEPGRYHAAHRPIAETNRALGLEDRLRSIPAAVELALEKAPRRGRKRDRTW